MTNKEAITILYDLRDYLWDDGQPVWDKETTRKAMTKAINSLENKTVEVSEVEEL